MQKLRFIILVFLRLLGNSLLLWIPYQYEPWNLHYCALLLGNWGYTKIRIEVSDSCCVGSEEFQPSLFERSSRAIPVIISGIFEILVLKKNACDGIVEEENKIWDCHRTFFLASRRSPAGRRKIRQALCCKDGKIWLCLPNSDVILIWSFFHASTCHLVRTKRHGCWTRPIRRIQIFLLHIKLH